MTQIIKFPSKLLEKAENEQQWREEWEERTSSYAYLVPNMKPQDKLFFDQILELNKERAERNAETFIKDMIKYEDFPADKVEFWSREYGDRNLILIFSLYQFLLQSR